MGRYIIYAMNKNMIKNIVLVLLIGITAFSMIQYLSELRERYSLQESLTQAQGKIVILEQEKQNLLQDIEKEKQLKEQLALKNANLKDYLRASKKKIARLFKDNAKTQDSLEELNAKLSILKAENKALIAGRKRIYAENEQFKFKLGSIAELKKAIKELRANRRKTRLLETEGNRGFLIKDGQPTAVERVRIEVIPAQTKE